MLVVQVVTTIVLLFLYNYKLECRGDFMSRKVIDMTWYKMQSPEYQAKLLSKCRVVR